MKLTHLTKTIIVPVLCGSITMACTESNDHKEGDIIKIKAEGVTFEATYVEPGSFTMGATPEHKGVEDIERPTHKVTLTKGYYIGIKEVTQEQWTAIMGSNPSQIKEFDNKEDQQLPVTDITWAEAKDFVQKLSEKSGRKVRLATEAEWEYAARGGKKTHSLPFSGSEYVKNVAAFKHTANGTSHPVGQFAINELGTYDMSGNVSEWVEDNFAEYIDSIQEDPCVQIADTLSHVARGGSFVSAESQCRTASREEHDADVKSPMIGLRIVIEKE